MLALLRGLTRSPGWAKLVDDLNKQIDYIKMVHFARRCTTMEEVLGEQYDKGQVAGQLIVLAYPYQQIEILESNLKVLENIDEHTRN